MCLDNSPRLFKKGVMLSWAWWVWRQIPRTISILTVSCGEVHGLELWQMSWIVCSNSVWCKCGTRAVAAVVLCYIDGGVSGFEVRNYKIVYICRQSRLSEIGVIHQARKLIHIYYETCAFTWICYSQTVPGQFLNWRRNASFSLFGGFFKNNGFVRPCLVLHTQYVCSSSTFVFLWSFDLNT